jgi:hypothetical protein
MKPITSFIETQLDLFVIQFGFANISDFFNSLVHPKLFLFTLPFSILSFSLFATLELWLGLSSMAIVGFVFAAILELITGLCASVVKGIPIVSRKFSRFGLKIFVWLGLLLVTNSFYLSYVDHPGILSEISEYFFYTLHNILVIYIMTEYIISILENFAAINGKSDSILISFIKSKRKQIFNYLDTSTTPKTKQKVGQDESTPQSGTNPPASK